MKLAQFNRKIILWKKIISRSLGCWLFLTSIFLPIGLYISLAEKNLFFLFVSWTPYCRLWQEASGAQSIPGFSLSINFPVYIFVNICLLGAIILWFYRPWRWWTAATLTVAGLWTSVFYFLFFYFYPYTLPASLLVYLFYFLDTVVTRFEPIIKCSVFVQRQGMNLHFWNILSLCPASV